jgi:uncharacterized protein
MEISLIKKKVLPILRKEKVIRAGIFGSFARGEETAKSDVDILVELPINVTLLGLAKLKRNLESVLGREVDLVEYCVIKKQIKKQILAEEVRVI